LNLPFEFETIVFYQLGIYVVERTKILQQNMICDEGPEDGGSMFL
jgi:hypothetical protein